MIYKFTSSGRLKVYTTNSLQQLALNDANRFFGGNRLTELVKRWFFASSNHRPPVAQLARGASRTINFGRATFKNSAESLLTIRWQAASGQHFEVVGEDKVVGQTRNACKCAGHSAD